MANEKCKFFITIESQGEKHTESEDSACFVIGKSRGADIILSLDGLSRRHLKVFVDENGQIWLEDLNSSFGTVVDGVKLVGGQPYCYNVGESIVIGAAEEILTIEWCEEGKQGQAIASKSSTEEEVNKTVVWSPQAQDEAPVQNPELPPPLSLDQEREKRQKQEEQAPPLPSHRGEAVNKGVRSVGGAAPKVDVQFSSPQSVHEEEIDVVGLVQGSERMKEAEKMLQAFEKKIDQQNLGGAASKAQVPDRKDGYDRSHKADFSAERRISENQFQLVLLKQEVVEIQLEELMVRKFEEVQDIKAVANERYLQENRIRELKTLSEEQKSLQSQLQQELARVEEALGQLETKFHHEKQKYAEEIKSFKSESFQVEQELVSQKLEMQRQKESLEERLKSVNAELSQAQSELQTAREQKEEVEAVSQKKVEEADRDVQGFRDEKKILLERLDEIEENIMDARKEFDSVGEEIEKSKSELETLDQEKDLKMVRLAEYKEHFAEQKEKFDEAQSQMEKDKAEAQALFDDWQKEIYEQKTKLERELKDKGQEIFQRKKEKDQELQEYSKALEEKKRERNSDFESWVKNLEGRKVVEDRGFEDYCKEIQAKKDQEQDKFQIWLDQLDEDKKQKVQEIEVQIKVEKDRYDELALDLLAQRSKAKKDFEDWIKANENDKLSRIGEYEAWLDKKDQEQQNRINLFRKELEAERVRVKALIEELELEKEGVREKYANLELDLISEHKDRLTELEDLHQKDLDSFKALGAKLLADKDEAERLTAEAEVDLKQAKANLSKERERLNKAEIEYERKFDRAEENLQSAENELESLGKKVKDYEEKLIELKGDLQSNQGNLDELLAEIRTVRTERAEIQKVVNQLKIDKEGLQYELSQFEVRTKKEVEEKSKFIISQAQFEVEKLRKITNEELENLRAATHEELDELKRQGREEADDLRAEAETYRHAAYEEANYHKEKVIGGLEEEKKAFEDQLAQLRIDEEEKRIEMRQAHEDQMRKAREDSESELIEMKEEMELQRMKEFDLLQRELKDKRNKEVEAIVSDRDKALSELNEAQQQFEREKQEISNRLAVLHEEVDEEVANRRKMEEKALAEQRLAEREDLRLELEAEKRNAQRGRKTEIEAVAKNIQMAFKGRFEGALGSGEKTTEEWMSEVSEVVEAVMGDDPDKKRNLTVKIDQKTRDRERRFWIKLGLQVSGGLLLLGLLIALPEGFFGALGASVWATISSDESAAEIFAQKILEAKANRPKFDPLTTQEFKETYADNMIFTTNYFVNKVDVVYQNEWTIALNEFVPDTLKLDEEVVPELFSTESVLIGQMAELIDKINPEFEDKGIARVREAEEVAAAKIMALLKGQENFQRFKDFEKSFYLKYFESKK